MLEITINGNSHRLEKVAFEDIKMGDHVAHLYIDPEGNGNQLWYGNVSGGQHDRLGVIRYYCKADPESYDFTVESVAKSPNNSSEWVLASWWHDDAPEGHFLYRFI